MKVAILVSIYLVIWLGLGPVVVSSDRFSIKVIDDLGKPVDDAMVVISWQVVGYHSDAGFLKIQEAFTDETGLVSIDGWSAFKLPWEFNIMVKEPSIVVFKPSLLPKEVRNNVKSSSALLYQHQIYEKSLINVVLSSAKGDDKLPPRLRNSLRNSLYPERNCWANIIPMSLNYLDVHKDLLTLDQKLILDKKHCDS